MVAPVVKPSFQGLDPSASDSAFLRLQETRQKLANRLVLRAEVKRLLDLNKETYTQLFAELKKVGQAFDRETVPYKKLGLITKECDLKDRVEQLAQVIRKQEATLEKYQSQISELEARVVRREARAAKYLLRDLLREPVIRDLNADKAGPVELPRHCGYDAW